MSAHFSEENKYWQGEFKNNLISIKDGRSKLAVMMITKELDLSEESPDRPVIAVRLDGEITEATACELLEGTVMASHLLDLPEVHVWAPAMALPTLAMAASQVDALPEGFQLRQLDAGSGSPSVDAEDNATWVSVESLLRMVRTRDIAAA